MGGAGRLSNRQIQRIKNQGKGDLLPHTAGLMPDSILDLRPAAQGREEGRAWNSISKGMADLECQERHVGLEESGIFPQSLMFRLRSGWRGKILHSIY